jgi:uncharacterized protein
MNCNNIKINSLPTKKISIKLSSSSLSIKDDKAQLSSAKQLIKKKDYQKALEIIERLVSNHYTPAQLLLADMYFHGRDGVEENKEKAVELYQQAAQCGSVIACRRLGSICDGDKNHEEKWFWYQKGAKLGLAVTDNDEETICAFAEIHNLIGIMYVQGLRTERDLSQALAHFQIAAEHGNATAQGNIGALYQLNYFKEPAQFKSGQVQTRIIKGDTIEKDHAQALAYYRASVEHGYPRRISDIESMYRYAHNVEKGHAETLTWNKDKQAARFARECTAMGDMYRLGNGVDVGFSKAKAWYQKAIEHNEPTAFRKLAQLTSYENKQLQKAATLTEAKDYKAAYEIYLPLAKKGSLEAQRRLGNMLYHGHGVEKNSKEAKIWLTKAVDGGSSNACNTLGYIFQAEKDHEKAVAQYKKGTERGSLAASNNLGYMYRYGLGIEKDLNQAKAYYRKAAEGGDSRGCFNFACLYYLGIGVKKDLAEALKWYEAAFKLENPSASDFMQKVRQEIDAMKCVEQKDYKGAYDLLLPLAQDGNPAAQLQIALMYIRGHHVQADATEAVRYLTLVDENSNKTPEIALPLGDAYMAIPFLFRRSEHHVGKALENYKIASDAGDSNASSRIAMFLIEAKDDETKIQHYLELAHEQGDMDAAWTLSNRFRNRSLFIHNQEDIQQADEWLLKAANRGNKEAKAQYILHNHKNVLPAQFQIQDKGL